MAYRRVCQLFCQQLGLQGIKALNHRFSKLLKQEAKYKVISSVTPTLVLRAWLPEVTLARQHLQRARRGGTLVWLVNGQPVVCRHTCEAQKTGGLFQGSWEMVCLPRWGEIQSWLQYHSSPPPGPAPPPPHQISLLYVCLLFISLLALKYFWFLKEKAYFGKNFIKVSVPCRARPVL